MVGWSKDNRRYRGEDEPSGLDLIFTEGGPEKEEVCMSPLRKSDHVPMLTKVMGEAKKRPKVNNEKANLVNTKEF